MRVAFQGETGAYSESAVAALYPTATALPLLSMEDVFDSVVEGRVKRGIIPIENSLFGSVHINYDLLLANEVRVVAEVQVRIRHHLVAVHGTTMASVESVHSHPQALGQCQTFLRTELPNAKIIPSYDTAGAAKMVAQSGSQHQAAIASRRAARKYGLDLLAQEIESHHKNFTRFLALAPPDSDEPESPPGTPHKTSIAFALQTNVPGALFKSLATFALRDLDLLKVESRPLVGSPGEYLFYLDIKGSRHDEPVANALRHLKELTASLKILGSYPAGKTWHEE